ncbi:ABC transporter permease [Puniceibacterium sp. IMCC21224]|uniref:ABC transporter permease n=1 Tax=Puniceibacterium sp. IMCC21224 TaxID=1618204 RepID=UPI00064E033D|nr:ABC transporter permease subunit [Puniceibacterium sp. IMCC21224]KMK66626.1 ABC-type nitrate/sulfonate/bicarbonate transport system, permease component [Puniceibacterium sp. IMCC21224]
MRRSVLPVVVVIAAILMLWYAGAVWLNAEWARDQARRAGVELTVFELVADTWAQAKPKLPAPHQVGVELWQTVAEKKVTSRRSLVYHAWITLSATLLGLGLGTVLGFTLAIGIVYNRVMDMSVMPWVIASQTIPILAIAPMIIVVLNAVGISGLLPKAIISMYLSFFPVVVGMVKGLRSPDRMMLDQMRTWNASATQEFWRLRLPMAAPYFFTSMKIAMAASLVGAIVGELPTGAVAGLGARLLAGSYYGQTIQIWSALIMAAALAALMVGLIGVLQRVTLKRMGMV